MRAGDKVHVEFDAVATGPDHIGSSLESVPIIRCSYLTNQFGATVTVAEAALEQGDIVRYHIPLEPDGEETGLATVVETGILNTHWVRRHNDDSLQEFSNSSLRRVDHVIR